MFKKIGFKLSIFLFIFLVMSACSSEAEENAELPENYPDEIVEVLVGFGAGGGTDLSARNMVEALNKEGIVDQSFKVTNMTGAEGNIAIEELRSRKGNEYTIEAIPEYGLGLWQEEARLEDFAPIAQVATDYQTIAVHKDSPYNTAEELLNAIKEDPKSIVISSATSLSGGVGWKWDQIINEAGMEDITPNIVPMEGENEALKSLLGKEADVTFVIPQLAMEHVENGGIKLLAVMTDERTEQFPDVPTLKEIGVNVNYYRPRGFWMNGDASEEAVKYWEGALKQMTETDTWKEYVKGSGLLNEFKGSEEYKNYIEEDGNSVKDYYESFSN